MHHTSRLLIGLLLLLVALGCNRSEAPPPALSIEQLQPALELVFAKAKPESKERLDSVRSALEAKDYSTAYLTLQGLSGAPGLTKEQARVVASGLMTLNGALQEAQTRGDEKAVQTLQLYRSTK